MIHNLSTVQLKKLTDAIGDGKNWPKFTDDPKVNHAVDCLTSLMINEEEEEPEWNEQEYLAEIQASQELISKPA